MTSQSKTILISVPIALLAYYCWLAKRKRSLGQTGLPGVGISEILAIIDKYRRQAEPRVTWTVQNTTRLRLKRSLSETDGESRLKMNDEAVCDIVAVEVEMQPQQKSAMEGVHDDGIHESDAASPSPELPGSSDACPNGFSDNFSEVSSDSGRGTGEVANLNSLSSETPEVAEAAAMEPITLYEFELAQPLVGLLIGKFGCNVNEIRDKCGAHVLVRKHPCNYRMKLITVEGTAQQIEDALVMIRRKFPPKRFPEVTLAPVNYLSSVCMGMPQSVIVPATFQLHLPASVMFDAYVSAVVSGGQLFLQQPTHPTYPSLKLMDQCMNDCYADANCPALPRPLDYGMVCAAPSHGGWYRAQVVSAESETQQVVIKFLDYGGYAELPASCLRQIRLDFMSLPFQAGECYLANIIPVDNEENGEGGEEWKAEAAYELETLCSGVVLQAEAVGSTVEGVSVVNLYRVMEDGSLKSINKEMVNKGFAKWLETPEEAYSSNSQEANDSQLSVEEGAVKEDEPAYSKPKKHKTKGKKKKDRRESKDVDEAAKLLNDLEVK